jgi:hypothetical protein
MWLNADWQRGFEERTERAYKTMALERSVYEHAHEQQRIR